MCYFCIFVLTFQTNIKFKNCHIVVFFVFVVEKHASLPSAGCLRAIKPHLITTHALLCNSEAACDIRLFEWRRRLNHRQSQQNEITLVPPRGELDRFSLTLCFYSGGVPAGAASQAACGGYSPPPVRAASDRPRARSHRQSNPGRVVFASSGSSFCSALGGRHQGAGGR